VHQYSGGIPRLINLLCDRSLLGAYSARSNRVTPELVERAAATLDLQPVERSRFSWLRRRTPLLAGAGSSSSVAYR
jgi:general secretion pathway protein A